MTEIFENATLTTVSYLESSNYTGIQILETPH